MRRNETRFGKTNVPVKAKAIQGLKFSRKSMVTSPFSFAKRKAEAARTSRRGRRKALEDLAVMKRRKV
jgi:hypothetical protein